MDNLGYLPDSDDSDDEGVEVPDLHSLCLNPYRWCLIFVLISFYFAFSSDDPICSEHNNSDTETFITAESEPASHSTAEPDNDCECSQCPDTHNACCCQRFKIIKQGGVGKVFI